MKTILQDLLDLKTINGGSIWDRHDGSIYNPIGFSTMDMLSVIGDMKIDYSKDEVVNEAIRKVISYFDKKSMMFKFSERSSKLPCITAKILSTISKLDYTFPEKEDCYLNFLDSQQVDGGWRCATVKLGKAPETDSSNPGTTLYVLDAFRFRNNSSEDNTQLEKGVEFLLNHWVTKKPLGPCEFGIGTTFMKTEYPFIRYNIFYYAYVLSFYGKAINDRRYKEIIEILKTKESDAGIKIENPHKNWKKVLYNESRECYLANQKYSELINRISKS